MGVFLSDANNYSSEFGENHGNLRTAKSTSSIGNLPSTSFQSRTTRPLRGFDMEGKHIYTEIAMTGKCEIQGLLQRFY